MLSWHVYITKTNATASKIDSFQEKSGQSRSSVEILSKGTANASSIALATTPF